MKKKTVLFVGSFKEKSDEFAIGGQKYACSTLLESSLGKEFNWILIDSTAKKNQDRSIFTKFFAASRRLALLLFYVLFRKIDYTLVFTSNGMSFKEKGLMIIIGKTFSKTKTILAPRSGMLKFELSRSSYFQRLVFKKADKIICQGNSWKMFFDQQFPYNNKYVVIPNWTTLSVSAIDNLPNQDENIKILFLGRLEKDKGIFDLIEAINNIKQNKLTTNQFQLNVCGKGTAESEVINEIERLSLQTTIILEGWVLDTHKTEILLTSDIFVLPSYYEGMPNSLLEAMANNTACIASNVGGIPDIITDGENGFLHEPRDVNGLTQHLVELLNSRERIEKFKKNGILRIQQNHSIEKAILLLKSEVFV